MNCSRKTKARLCLRRKFARKTSEFSSPLSIGLLQATPGAKDPVDAILRHARELVHESGITKPPFRPALLAPLRKVNSILYRNIEEEGRLIPYKSDFAIELRMDRSFQRKNFTCAHEIAHTFFYQAVPSIKYRRLNSTEVIRDSEEELLCNIAASELLLPLESLQEVAGDYIPSPTSLLEIAQIYETSLSATAIRLLSLNLWDAKFILWDCDELLGRARWFAKPHRALAHYPSVEIENFDTSGIRQALSSGEEVESEEWLCIDKRFTYCQISSMRLENSNRVLSCIGRFSKAKTPYEASRQLPIPTRYECECNGTRTQIVRRNGYSYALPCLAPSHEPHQTRLISYSEALAEGIEWESLSRSHN